MTDTEKFITGQWDGDSRPGLDIVQAPTPPSKYKKYYYNKWIYDTFRMAPLNCC